MLGSTLRRGEDVDAPAGRLPADRGQAGLVHDGERLATADRAARALHAAASNPDNPALYAHPSQPIRMLSCP